jgi:histidinol-phosphate aminotransferase
MENPYSWPEGMVDDWLLRLRDAALNRYPDPTAQSLRDALRVSAGLPEGSEILLGNGSDELIQLILMAVSGRQAAIVAPEPTFVMYRQLSESMGLRFVGVPLRESDFSLDMDAMRDAIRSHEPAVVFLAYPNNPTGNLFSDADVEAILAMAPGLVVLDEAYLPFAGASFLARVMDHERLLVMRTLSKLGLAGLRLGYLVGAPEWIREFEKLRLPYNINILTQISAEFALSRPEVFERQIEQILEQREWLFREMLRIPGLRAFPTQANFILFELESHQPGAIFDSLRAKGVLIKSFASATGPLGRCLRVTVGTPDENRQFLSALSESLSVSV